LVKRIRRDRGAPDILPLKKRGTGQPPHEPTEDTRKQAKGMALANIKIKRIAEIIGISEPTLRLYYADEIMGARERMLGKAALTLEQALDGKPMVAGQLGACCFTLKAQGKDFGWSERTEHTGKDGDPLLPSLENLSDEQLKQLADARRVLAEIAPRVAGRDGDSAPGAPGSTRIH